MHVQGRTDSVQDEWGDERADDGLVSRRKFIYGMNHIAIHENRKGVVVGPDERSNLMDTSRALVER